jgi:transcription initiation factor TFIIF subunit alpha
MNTSQQAPGTSIQEYSIRVPKNMKKKYHVMKFTSSVNIDFSKWSQVKMERENNMKEFRGTEEEMPKFGAGSEFGRDAREEARRKKHGIVSRKYRPEDQPWILKVGGKTGKKFRGNREGGIGENASYYVFTHASDGAIEAFPLQEWYKFQPIQRYKSLSAEEAEEQFGRRHKVVNYFSLMLQQRMRSGDEDGDLEDPEEGKTKKSSGGSKKELKISDMDEWIDSDDDSDDSDSSDEKKDREEKEEDKKKKTKKGLEVKKKKKKDSDDEAFEESDDGDEEGRELDYDSDSSESVSEPEQVANKELKGVAEEDALRKLLSSGEEDEEEEEEKEDGEKDSEGEDKSGNVDADRAGGTQNSKEKDSLKKGSGGSAGVGPPTASSSTKKKKKKKKNDHSSGSGNVGSAKKGGKKDESHDSSSDFSSDSSDSDDNKKKHLKDLKSIQETNSGASSRSGTPTKEGFEAGKRKLPPAPEPGTSQTVANSKRARLDNFSSAALSPYYNTGNPGSSDSGITEDAVRRYLMRKPMTTTELLQKFKSKKTGLTSDQLVNVMTQILKRINPLKQTIKGKMYLSIKP